MAHVRAATTHRRLRTAQSAARAWWLVVGCFHPTLQLIAVGRISALQGRRVGRLEADGSLATTGENTGRSGQ